MKEKMEKAKDLFRRILPAGVFSRVSKSDLVCGPSKTQPHHQDELDINNIVARFQRTGELPTRKEIPYYGDHLLRAPSSLQEANERIIKARQGFLELPSALRAEFRNSPNEFYDKVTRGDKSALMALSEHGYAIPKMPKGNAPDVHLTHSKKEQKAEPDAKQGT